MYIYYTGPSCISRDLDALSLHGMESHNSNKTLNLSATNEKSNLMLPNQNDMFNSIDNLNLSSSTHRSVLTRNNSLKRTVSANSFYENLREDEAEDLLTTLHHRRNNSFIIESLDGYSSLMFNGTGGGTTNNNNTSRTLEPNVLNK